MLAREVLPKIATTLRFPSYSPTVCGHVRFFFFNKFMAFMVVILRKCEVPVVASI